MLDIFIGFFGNAINIVISLIFVLIGILIGIVIVRYVMKPKNQILYCRERDGRGIELNVGDEDAVCLETNSKPELRFFKYGRSYEFRRRGRSFTRFFGKEGTAYTWVLQGFHKVATKFKTIENVLEVKNEETGKSVVTQVERKVPIEWKEESIDIPFPTLEDAIKFRWGKFYEAVPDEQKDLLRDDKVLVTVNLEPGIVPSGYKPITESVIKKKANEDMAELMAYSLKGAVKKSVLDWMPWLLAGAGIMAIASKFLGWW